MQALLDLQIDPRRRAADQPVHHGEVLASAELLAGASEQHDDVAFALNHCVSMASTSSSRPTIATVGVGGMVRPSVSL